MNLLSVGNLLTYTEHSWENVHPEISGLEARLVLDSRDEGYELLATKSALRIFTADTNKPLQGRLVRNLYHGSNNLFQRQ